MERVARILLILAPVIPLMLLTRPMAHEWPDAVVRLRKKERNAAGSLASALEPVKAAWRSDDRHAALLEMARARLSIGTHESEVDARVWATDAVLLTVGCTKKKCYVGILGQWRPLPGAESDLYVLLACHGAACALAHSQGMPVFFRWCSPRMSSPFTLLTSIFATASPFEMLWLYGTMLGVGRDLQRGLGRLGFLALYLGGGLSSVLVAAYFRHSANGAGGALAAFAYHALAAPNARHSIFGLEMGARMSLAAQAALASYPAFNGAARPELVLALNGLPILIGAALFHNPFM